MKKYSKISIVGLSLIIVGFVACGPDTRLDMIGMISGTSPTIDKRVEESFKYNEQKGFVTLQAHAEEYHVYVCTDTHITDSRNRWEYFINTYRADELCPVALHLGDIIDAQTDFEYVQEALTLPRENSHNPQKHDTLMAVIGNHDIYFKQWPKYIAAFKTSTYYFIVQTPSGARDLYIITDSADGTIGRKQLKWLTETLQWADTQNFRHIIAASHTHFFKRDNSQTPSSNYNMEEAYTLLNLFASHGVEMLWSGHDHHREITEVKTLTSVVLDSMKDNDEHPFYMLVKMGEKIAYDFVAVP